MKPETQTYNRRTSNTTYTDHDGEHFVEIIEWYNGAGIDIQFDNHQHISLEFEQWDAMMLAFYQLRLS